MTRQIAATEFRARIAEMLRWVEAGETVLITRHGRVALRLAPEGEAEREACSRAMERFDRHLAGKNRIRMTLPEMLARDARASREAGSCPMRRSSALGS